MGREVEDKPPQEPVSVRLPQRMIAALLEFLPQMSEPPSVNSGYRAQECCIKFNLVLCLNHGELRDVCVKLQLHPLKKNRMEDPAARHAPTEDSVADH